MTSEGLPQRRPSLDDTAAALYLMGHDAANNPDSSPSFGSPEFFGQLARTIELVKLLENMQQEA